MVVRPQGGLARAEPGQRRFGVGRDRGTSGWPGTTVRHDRSDPDPLGDRAGRPTGRRATAPAGLRRAAQAGRPEAGPGEARADPPGHGPGPRGVPPAASDREQAQDWNSRGHFFAAAAEAMRRILVDNARRKRRPKHGGDQRRRSRSTTVALSTPTPVRRAARPRRGVEPARRGRAAQGRSWSSSATSPACRSRRPPQCVGISPITAYEHWAYARAWLHAAPVRRRVTGAG